MIFKRFICCIGISILILASLLLSACGGTGVDDKNNDVSTETAKESDTDTGSNTETLSEADTSDALETVDIDESTDLSKYKIVRSDISSAAAKKIVTEARKNIKNNIGIDISIGTDYDDPIDKEILIGKTNRDESVRAMAALKTDYDYIIRQDGDKVVIAAGDEALETAISVFIDTCIDSNTKKLIIPEGDGIVYNYELALDSLKIDGVDISKFTVVDKTIDKDQGESFVKRLATGFAGVTLKTFGEEVKNSIVIDGSMLTYTDYEIKFENGSAYITAGYHSMDAAVEKFFELLSVGGDLDLTSENNIKGSIKDPIIPYKNKDELYKIIESVYESDNFLMGEHLAGGMSPNSLIENYYKAVGESPSIIDFDMLRLKDNSKAQWSKTLCELVEFAEKGGIITSMHHWLSPIAPENGYRGNLGTLKEWREVITDGTELNLKWREELDRAAEFLKAMNDAGVAMLYRPMHEVNGSWFWFCVGQANGVVIPSEDTIDMWRYVYDYYTDVWEIKDILWEYGPNVSQNAEPVESGTQPVDYYYPGEDYCDVVGYDWYTSGNYEIDNGIVDCHTILADLRHPVGIMEFGVGGNIRTDDPEIQPDVFSCYGYTEIFDRMRDEGKKLAFVEVYAGIFGSPTVLGHGEALANYKYIIHLEDMPEIIKSILG